MRLGHLVLVLGLSCGLVRGQAVRYSIFTLDPNGPEISSLRHGIEVMQSRDENDPTSWSFQAKIHATYDQGSQAWNKCQHGNFYFLSWHRMYLYYFERILRDASGDPNLTLPYWNYTDDANVNSNNAWYSDPTDVRRLPLPFRQPADSTASRPAGIGIRTTLTVVKHPATSQAAHCTSRGSHTGV